MDRPEFESYLYPLVAMESWARFNISDTSFSFFFLIIMGWEDPLEEGMATHSSILAWRIPTGRGARGLQSLGSQRVGHD